MASLIIAGVVSLAWCSAALWIGPRTGYLDRPDTDPLKIHERAAVPLGGVGVYLGFHVAAVIDGQVDPAMLAATTLVLVLGLLDDRWGLPPLLRLVVEIGAAVVLVVGVQGVGGPVATFLLGVALVVFAINAVNLFDGLDGLAGSVALVAAVGIAVLTSIQGGMPGDGLALAGGLAGFLVLGWPPARVFLGDAGAYVIGVILAGLIIRGSEGKAAELVVAAGLLGVFALDLLVTVIRRLHGRRPLFEGDRSHLYDQLRDRGHPVSTIVVFAATAQAVLSTVVIGVDTWLPGANGVLVLLALGLGMVAMAFHLGFSKVEPCQ